MRCRFLDSYLIGACVKSCDLRSCDGRPELRTGPLFPVFHRGAYAGDLPVLSISYTDIHTFNLCSRRRLLFLLLPFRSDDLPFP
ncbi:hypothetical protein D3C75_547000 [compost metagenome]